MKRAHLYLIAYPLVGAALILVIWQSYVDLFAVSKIVLPGPLAIYGAAQQNFALLMR
jgi:NitT/TauT family transport system permease protein